MRGVVLVARVRRDSVEVFGGIECASSFRGVSDCLVYELACRVVSAYGEILLSFALARNVCARVREVAQGAIVRGGVAVSFG